MKFHIPTLLTFLCYCFAPLFISVEYSLVFQWFYVKCVFFVILLYVIRCLLGGVEIDGMSVLRSFSICGIAKFFLLLMQLNILYPMFPNNYVHQIAGCPNLSILGYECYYFYISSLYIYINSSKKCINFWSILSICYVVLIFYSQSRLAIFLTYLSTILISRNLHLFDVLRFKNKYRICWISFLFAIMLIIAKFNSFKGRLLIWIVTISMIKVKPLIGWGTSGFTKNYMNFQATYFHSHPNSDFSMMADNVFHPFNEFLNLAVQYGVLLSIFVIILCVIGLWYIWKNRRSFFILSICAIICFSLSALVSYPFYIPFTWLIISYILGLYLYRMNTKVSSSSSSLYYFLLLSLVVMVFLSTKQCIYDVKRLNLSRDFNKESSDRIIDNYAKNYDRFKDNEAFLYDYGSMLHYVGDYEASLKILHRCSNVLADYNLQLLLADDYRSLGKVDSALVYLDVASFMIPCRFLPLYYKMVIYDELGRNDSAIYMANILLNKPSKIKKSLIVDNIKNEARSLIESSKCMQYEK